MGICIPEIATIYRVSEIFNLSFNSSDNPYLSPKKTAFRTDDCGGSNTCSIIFLNLSLKLKIY